MSVVHSVSYLDTIPTGSLQSFPFRGTLRFSAQLKAAGPSCNWSREGWKPLAAPAGTSCFLWKNSPNSPISGIICTSVPFSGRTSEAQLALNQVTPSELLWKSVFLGFFSPAAEGRWKFVEVCSFISSSLQAWGTLSPVAHREFQSRLSTPSSHPWSPSKINWRSVRPESPQPTQEKTSTKYKYPTFPY